ncbi:MAG: hypothetical protein LBQ16_01040 [Gracilibacteraceae bacterium]|jgi:flagellar biosynthesis/type III secretory pathway protein FliH|nr:hypothetical protein [Gracilibacteraceae bacterium]
MAKSPALKGYAEFIAKVRESARAMKLEDAIKAAIEYCVERDILREFLQANEKEVTNMLSRKFNLDDAIEVWKEEAREDGLAEGMEKGIEKGRAEGRAEILQMLRSGVSTEEIERRLADLSV